MGQEEGDDGALARSRSIAAPPSITGTVTDNIAALKCTRCHIAEAVIAPTTVPRFEAALITPNVRPRRALGAASASSANQAAVNAVSPPPAASVIA